MLHSPSEPPTPTSPGTTNNPHIPRSRTYPRTSTAQPPLPRRRPAAHSPLVLEAPDGLGGWEELSSEDVGGWEEEGVTAQEERAVLERKGGRKGEGGGKGVREGEEWVVVEVEEEMPVVEFSAVGFVAEVLGALLRL